MTIDYTLRGSGLPLNPFGRWRRSILLIRRAVAGMEVSSHSLATSAHRPPRRFQMIDFGAELSPETLLRNGLQDVSSHIKLNEIETLARALQIFGPLIACGRFGMFNSIPSAIIIRGCDTKTQHVMIYDAGFAQGNVTKPWTYIVEHVRRTSVNEPAPTAFVADDPHPSEVIARKKKKKKSG